jgi:hypothetical protein
VLTALVVSAFIAAAPAPVAIAPRPPELPARKTEPRDNRAARRKARHD